MNFDLWSSINYENITLSNEIPSDIKCEAGDEFKDITDYDSKSTLQKEIIMLIQITWLVQEEIMSIVEKFRMITTLNTNH